MALWLMTALIVKHFICDFPLQACPWMYRNKGTYGHAGGIVHALIHYLGTYIVLRAFGVPNWSAWMIGTTDGLIHYHIDWAKMRLNAAMGWGPHTSEWFWILLGFDQLLHSLTYVGIVWWLT